MDFNHLMVPCLAKAFSGASALTSQGRHSAVLPGAPLLWPRSQVGPRGSTISSAMVDYQMTMPHSGRVLERAATIGEMERPLTVRGKEWGSRGPVSTATTKLQRELRGLETAMRSGAEGVASIVVLSPGGTNLLYKLGTDDGV
ncbi:uncharacterized protein N7446_010864 [Penicillium canescens]|uniref:Uncharacterized protein n=1 Tax=Penicillium canescens TaxID=5083 RepID=A0AAD6IAW0_PENCN|nr:uncharacterized protein N7446_010864 [Penicillium canescens]KAJ6041243.1 hypothetical protein N7460_006633 [Penicillium canescens]KAJ6050755.1 hypothetical protein N7446_010864 [Penicillium canescens]KAJ6065968.1 hypothetical protein N7444_001621 [Penicillium canescens]